MNLNSINTLDEIPVRTASDQPKWLGFSDFQIARSVLKDDTGIHAGWTCWKCGNTGKNWELFPYVKQIDTLAAEYPARPIICTLPTVVLQMMLNI